MDCFYLFIAVNILLCSLRLKEQAKRSPHLHSQAKAAQLRIDNYYLCSPLSLLLDIKFNLMIPGCMPVGHYKISITEHITVNLATAHDLLNTQAWKLLALV